MGPFLSPKPSKKRESVCWPIFFSQRARGKQKSTTNYVHFLGSSPQAASSPSSLLWPRRLMALLWPDRALLSAAWPQMVILSNLLGNSGDIEPLIERLRCLE